ncbi:MAG: prolipoprotein diacylglyceryl transferase [Chloroflexi bacterium]|nr:prolipoprotein diacylglyceryl transferase [Chloroflexota bacterium]
MEGAAQSLRTGRAVASGLSTNAQSGSSETVEPEALVVSHCFDSGEDGEPYSATVRLTGRRVGLTGIPRHQDTFAQDDLIEAIVPGSGPVSITSWVYGLAPGEWTVGAELLRPGGGTGRGRRVAAEPIRPATWSWRRWALATATAGTVKTRWAMLAPLARMPGVIPGSWPALGTLGAIVALITQAAILTHESVPVGPSLIVSLIALASGMIGAKVWYAVLHPGPWRQAILGGWAVDGFLIVAPIVAVVTLLALYLPVGRFLDAATPGLFFGVAIGRVGCFFTGCCAGRVSRSRWGIWSSDQRVGARRVPAQLLESASGLMIGAAAGVAVLGHLPSPTGAVFAAAVLGYLLVRQALLRVRAERREFSWRRRSARLNPPV